MRHFVIFLSLQLICQSTPTDRCVQQQYLFFLLSLLFASFDQYMYESSQNIALNLYIGKLLNRDKNNLLQMAHTVNGMMK